jgi:hypothetical protein
LEINAKWHKAHVMPKNPTLDQRLDWHEAHAKACGCRPLTPAIRAQIRRRAGERAK